ncbi:MAG: LysO family transporter [Alloprevotella sp.]
MLTVFFIMLLGVGLGYVFGRRLAWVRHGVLPLIGLLLFLLGMEVGGDERIMSSWGTIGMDAVVITLAATGGSVVAAWLLWRVANRRTRERRETEGLE